MNKAQSQPMASEPDPRVFDDLVETYPWWSVPEPGTAVAIGHHQYRIVHGPAWWAPNGFFTLYIDGVKTLEHEWLDAILGAITDIDNPAHEKPIESLTCRDCGKATTGRQWPARDTGIGICADCAAFLADVEISADYGRRGYHFDAFR